MRASRAVASAAPRTTGGRPPYSPAPSAWFCWARRWPAPRWLNPHLVAYRSDDTWVVGSFSPLTIQPVAPDMGALGRVDLALEFKGPVVMRLDDTTEVVTTASGQRTRFLSWSTFTPPAGALLPLSVGLGQLKVTAGGVEVGTSPDLRPLADGSTSWLQGHVPPDDDGWNSAPQGAGIWHVTPEQQLVGSSHLMPSHDLGCTRLDCLPVQSSTANPNESGICYDVVHELRPVVSSVPEPGAGALLLAGCGALAWMRRRPSAPRVG